MSRRFRLIICSVLVLLAFGAGIFAYAHTQIGQNKAANAEEGLPNYLVAENGKIKVPAEPTEGDPRSSRGTEDNPFFVLEIVPYEGMASFGYHISGCEPIDVDAAARDGLDIPGGSTYYDIDYSATFRFWEGKQPTTFTVKKAEEYSGSVLPKMHQYGTMTYVTDGSGNYNIVGDLDDFGVGIDKKQAEYQPVAGGSFVWEPLSADECYAMKDDATAKVPYEGEFKGALTDGTSFKMYFKDVTYVEGTGRKVTHKHIFLKESVGLKYAFDANGVRYELPEAEVNEKIKNYKSVVYTVTPEDLNMNPELIDRADLIVISPKTNLLTASPGCENGWYTYLQPGDSDMIDESTGKYLEKYKYYPYLKKHLFGYQNPDGQYGRKENKPGATFNTNLLDWSIVEKIAGRAMDDTHMLPVIMENLIFQNAFNNATHLTENVQVTAMYADGNIELIQSRTGTQENMAKLYLILCQMKSSTFKSLYGNPGDASNVLFTSQNMEVSGSSVQMKNNAYLKTGVFNYDNGRESGKEGSPESRVYWHDTTLIPWHLLPTTGYSSPSAYASAVAVFGIATWSDGYSMTSGAAQNVLRNGLMGFSDNGKLTSGLDSQPCGIKNNIFGAQLYEYFDAINGDAPVPPENGTVAEGALTTADCLFYLLNGVNGGPTPVNDTTQYKILELQPTSSYQSEEYWNTLMTTYTNSIVNPEVKQMTTSEFIGSHVECLEYDMIYVGMRKRSDDPRMDFSGGGATNALDLSAREHYAGNGTGTYNADHTLKFSDNQVEKCLFPLNGTIASGVATEVKVTVKFDNSHSAGIRFWFTDDAGNTKSDQYTFANSGTSTRTTTFTLTPNSNVTKLMLASSSYGNKMPGLTICEILVGSGGDDGAVNYVYAHTGPKVEVANQYRALYGWLRSGQEGKTGDAYRNEEKYFVLSGNDLTDLALEKLMKYDEAGFPIMFGDGFYSSFSGGSYTMANTIDRNSNIYTLGGIIDDSGSKSVCSGDLNGSNLAKATELMQTLTSNNKKVDMVFAISPVLFDSNKPDERDRYINGYNNSYRTLYYKFKVKAPAGTSYQLRLFVDSNTDGYFKEGQEDVGAEVFEVLSNGSEGAAINSGIVEAGEWYYVKRQVMNRVGSVVWKLELVKDGKVYASESGVSAIQAKPGGTEDVHIKVLQIVPGTHSFNATAGLNSLTLPTQEEIDQYEATGTGLTGSAEKFYNGIKDLDGLDLKFFRMSQEEIETAAAGISGENMAAKISTYLYENYDMLVLGFADIYNGVSDPDVLKAIESFVDKGKAVLYTHDTSSGISTESDNNTLPVWGRTITEAYREFFGMDRYGAKQYYAPDEDAEPEDIEEILNNKDIPYVPASKSADAGKVYTNKNDNSGGRQLIQGVTNGMLYRTQYPQDSDPDGDKNLNAHAVTRVNQGAITEYPYTIPETIEIASTHPQYYQLDMEHKDMVVWYCLAAGTTVSPYEESYFGSSVNDVRSDYYIYNKGNVTYSGMGHMQWGSEENSVVLPDHEIQLFINTFVAAYRAPAVGVKVEVVNDDATGDSSGDQYLCVDVDSSDADEIIGNDIVNTYKLQVADTSDGEGYVQGSELTRKSKRVYFRLIDNNTYGDAEYEVTIVLNNGLELDGVQVDGTNQMFAVYERNTGAFVDCDDVKYEANTTYYYVDVPINIETTTNGRAVGKTELKVTVKMNYLIGEESFSKTDTTKVSILPRGFYRLN